MGSFFSLNEWILEAPQKTKKLGSWSLNRKQPLTGKSCHICFQVHMRATVEDTILFWVGGILWTKKKIKSLKEHESSALNIWKFLKIATFFLLTNFLNNKPFNKNQFFYNVKFFKNSRVDFISLLFSMVTKGKYLI